MQTYNGHKNYETWLVSLYLDGNYTGEGTCLEAREIARECGGRGELMDALKDFMANETDTSDHAVSPLVADLIGAALSEVDLYTIAGDLLAEVAEESA